MIKKVICVKEIELTQYDDDGYSNDEYFTVLEGTIFDWDEENTHRVIGGDIYLENDEMWIELTKEDFEECFEEIKE